MTPPTEEVLEERLIGLSKSTAAGFDRVEKKLDTMSRDMVTFAHFDLWCERIVKNEVRLLSHDIRLVLLERVTWLLGIVGGLALTIIAALLVAWATGNMMMVWK